MCSREQKAGLILISLTMWKERCSLVDGKFEDIRQHISISDGAGPLRRRVFVVVMVVALGGSLQLSR